MAEAPEPTGLRQQVTDLARLAGPVIVARTSVMTMGLVDTVMIGRYGAEELGYVAMGNAAHGVVLVTGLGLLIGTLVFTANAFGAGNFAECGQVWRRSLPYAFLLGIAGLVGSAFAEPLLLLTGQTPDVAREGGRVTLILGLGLPLTLAYIASSSFLEGIKRPMAGMVIMLIANVVNAAANWVLIFGELGAPEMGAQGAAWATTVVRTVTLVLIVGYIWTMRDGSRFGVRIPAPGGWLRNWPAWAEQRRLGFAQGMSAGIEVGAFSALTLLAGLLGAITLAAYAIVFNVLAMIFMVALGFATATAVRVGNAKGAEDHSGAAIAGWLGLIVCIVPLSLCAVGLWLTPELVARAYTTDAILIAAATPVIAFTAWVVVLDGCQAVMSSALRGWGDVWVPTVMHTVSYALIMLPAAWWLTQPMGRGATGLMEAILIGSIASMGMLTIRFQYLTRRDSQQASLADAVAD